MFVALAENGRAAPPPVWVVMAPGGGSIVRAVGGAGRCPAISVDGVSRRMTLRAAPATLPSRPSASGSAAIHPSAFPLSVCETAVPRSARTARIAATRVPLPPKLISRIVVVGDTGCRLKAADKAWQACNDPGRWPFAAIAAAAARTRPDLVVHVGDYHYRETPCPADNSGCANSPWGYGYDSWNADLLRPAAPLLAAAPWAMARGNHEACDRAGQGWHRLLDPHPLIAGRDCLEPANDFAGNHTAPYAVDLGDGAQLIILDLASAGSDPLNLNDPRVARFAADAAVVAKLARPGKTSFLVGHYPFAAVRTGANGRLEIGNLALSATFGAGLLPKFRDINAMLSGHVHQFEQVSFGGEIPSQIVTGFSGTLEDDQPAPSSARGIAPLANGLVIRSLRSIAGLQGFVLLEREARDRWALSVRDATGAVRVRCNLQGRRSSCRSAS